MRPGMIAVARGIPIHLAFHPLDWQSGADGWHHVVVSRSGRQRFRHSSALTVAAVILLIGVVTVASWQPYLLVLLLDSVVAASAQAERGAEQSQGNQQSLHA